MTKKKKIKLTEHISYSIIDNTIYLFQDNDYISGEEMEIVVKRLLLVIEVMTSVSGEENTSNVAIKDVTLLIKKIHE